MTAASTKYDKKDLLRILQSDPWVKGSVSKSDFLDECHRLSHLEGLGFIECDFVIGGYRYKGLTPKGIDYIKILKRDVYFRYGYILYLIEYGR